MTGRLEGKVAFITGAASGMGRSTAQRFAAEGAAVTLADMNEEQSLATQRAILDQGGRASFVQTDVTTEESIASAVEHAVSTFGKLDTVVNAAGVIGVDAPTHEVTEADLELILAVDLKGVFFSTKHTIPHLIANGGGAIVNFSSIYGLIGNDEFTPYHIAKGAVTMQTRQDAASYGRYNIRVNSVCPSTVLTPLVQGIADAYPGGLPAYEKMMTENQSIQRMGRPEEVAAAVLFLASDEASWITGVNLPLDGGYTAR